MRNTGDTQINPEGIGLNGQGKNLVNYYENYGNYLFKEDSVKKPDGSKEYRLADFTDLPSFLKKYSNKVSAGIFRTDKITIADGVDQKLDVTGAELYWHIHFKLSDWSKLKKPAIRITMHDDPISATAQLQLVYGDGYGEGDDPNNAAWRYERDYEQVKFTSESDDDGQPIVQTDENGNYVLADKAWQGRVLELNPEYLASYPWLLITTNTYWGVDFVKVEICDAAYNADGTAFEE